MTTHRGSCLCGAIRFELAGDIPPPGACHCSLCRRQSGHFFASADVERSAVAIDGEDKVRWYQASEKARRGFCPSCGAFLFWQDLEGDRIAIGMGAFDLPTSTRLERHIFVADKGDYYDIADGLPQQP